MRWISFLVIFILLANFGYAESIFDASDVIPPSLPSSDIIAKDNLIEITLILADWNNNLVENIHLAITVDSDEGLVKTLKYTESGDVQIFVESGMRKILLTGDSLNTHGGDYYYIGEFEAIDGVEVPIRFLPVGSVRGIVSSSDGLSDGAFVKFVCGKRYGLTDEMTTDHYGSFTNDYLPVGTCRIQARDNGNIGFAENIEIKSGEITTVKIELNQKSSRRLNMWPFIIGGIIIAVSVIVFRYSKKQPKKVKTNGSRTTDLLKTLNVKEQAIVKLLMEEGELYQNKISHNTSIPKTSLVRILTGLHTKKIVDLIKIGKTKKIKLTKWFLNKEK